MSRYLVLLQTAVFMSHCHDTLIFIFMIQNDGALFSHPSDGLTKETFLLFHANV